MELKELHEEVFKFLLEKRKADPSLRYTLRTNDTGKKLDEGGKLTKGHWFLGGDKLYVSFWDAYPKVNDKTLTFPTIRFEINATDGKCGLYIDARQKNSEEVWGGNLSLSLDLKDTKKVGDRWVKIYKDNDFRNSLEHFITIERPFINSFFKLRGVESDYPQIGEVQFLERFNKIQNLRRGKTETQFNEILKNRLIVDTLDLKSINVFKSLKINFNKHVTCFVGGNGSGKTSILRATALGLVGASNFESKKN